MVALLVLIVCAAGIAVTTWLESRPGLHSENSLEDVVLSVGFGMFAKVGALLVAKRPENPIGWIMTSVALMMGIFPALETYAAYVMATSGGPNTLAVVASTLLIAALFGPLRRRVQGLIDRRFYRRKYETIRVLEAFSERLRDASDLDGLNGELIAVIGEAVHPEHASFWLRERVSGEGGKPDA